MNKYLKLALLLTISFILLYSSAVTAFAESITGITVDHNLEWDDFPGAEEYEVELYLGSMPAVDAQITRSPWTGILPSGCTIRAMLFIRHDDVDIFSYPYGIYTVYITAKDANGNAISDRTKAGQYTFGLENMVNTTYRTVTFSPDGGSGESYTIFAPESSRNDILPFEIRLPDSYFTPPEGKEFDRWSAGAPGDRIIAEPDMVITPVWKDIGSSSVEPAIPDPVKIGDIDGDGALTLKDISHLKAYIAGNVSISEIISINSDIDGDGVIGLIDISTLKALISG